MRVLVVCEFSGTVRDAFAKLGHDAWSCDILPGKGNHIQASAWGLDFSGWDLLVGHPPCTYFSHVANGHGHAYVNSPERTRKRQRALEFVRHLWDSGVPYVCLENPRGRLETMFRTPDQKVNVGE